MPRRARSLMALALALVASVGVLRAQTPDFSIRAARSSKPTVAPGAVFTAAFTIINATATAGRPNPVVTLPPGWTALTALAPPTVPANGSDLWLVSVATPQNVRAGAYVLHVGVESRGVVSRDSVLVSISEHRALDIRALPGNGYVPAGEWYTARFSVRNVGNAESRVKVHGTTSFGDRLTIDSTELRLAPGAASTVTVRIKTLEGMRSVDDIVDMFASDADHDEVNAEATQQTTIIASGTRTGATYWTLPGELWVRASDARAGVSPIVAWGAGRISETSATTVDFAIRTHTAPTSLFGERDEYRLGLRSERGALLLGDQQFGYSFLTSPGAIGTGGELRANVAGLTSGAYVQRNRLTPGAPVEAAAMFGTAQTRRTGGTAVVVNRQLGASVTRLFGATGRAALGAASDLEIELAGSDSNGVRDVGQRGRLAGALGGFTYDLGGEHGGVDFNGYVRAQSDGHLSVSMPQLGPVLVTSSTSLHGTAAAPQNGGFAPRAFTSNLTAGFNNGSAIAYDVAARSSDGWPGLVDGQEHALALRGHLAIGTFDLLVHSRNGVVLLDDSAATRQLFAAYGASARTVFGRSQYISVFGEMTDGRSLGGGGFGTVTAGANAQLRIPLGFTFVTNATASAPRGQLRNWAGESEVRVEHRVLDMTLSLRAHLSQSGGTATAGQNGFFVELRRPLHVPTARLDLGGRARGRVVDGGGRPVAGAMVRIGPQAAVTNAAGEVDFRGLDTGYYRASVEGTVATGRLAIGGDSIVVRNGAKHPAPFTLTLTEGARVSVRVRRFETAPGQLRLAFDSAGKQDTVARRDSLIDVGAVADLAVALIGVRDTVLLQSDGLGRLDFGTVAPGVYTVTVLAADIPEFTTFQESKIDLVVKAGDERSVELRMIPKKRAVHIIGGETEVKVLPPKGGGSVPR